jgi:hypothetical protein
MGNNFKRGFVIYRFTIFLFVAESAKKQLEKVDDILLTEQGVSIT